MLSMQKKIVLFLLLFIIVPILLINSLVGVLYRDVLRKKLSETSQQALIQISNNIDTLINNMISVSNVIVQDREVLSILSAGESSYQDQRTIGDKITKAQNSALYAYNSDLMLFDFHGNYYTIRNNVEVPVEKSYGEIAGQEWFEKTVQMDGYMNWSSPDRNNLNFLDYSDGNICMSRVVKDPSYRFRYGVVLVSIYPTGKFGKLLSVREPEEDLYLTDADGKILLSSSPERIGRSLAEYGLDVPMESGSGSLRLRTQPRGEAILDYRVNAKSGMRILRVLPYDVLMRESDRIGRTVLLINALLFLLLLVVGVCFSYSFTRPVKELIRSMEQVAQGDFAQKIPIKGRSEVSRLGESYNRMVGEIQRLVGELELSYRQREELRFESLQAQINPHFILNTLNGIKLLATMGGASAAAKMTVALGNMLEHILGRSEELVALSEEMRCADSYILLEKMRFGDSFRVEKDVPAELEDLRIPGMLLQPILENAILHGLSGTDRTGVIRILARREEGAAVIEISDNGVGMTDEQIESLLKSGETGRTTHIGIKNVDERLRLIYGPGGGLRIISEKNVGTTVRMVLPDQNGMARPGGKELA